MNTLLYLHWNEDELKSRVKPLMDLGLNINLHWSIQEKASWGETPPDIFVISLDRLPSHGRQYAQWFWEAKKRQHIPIFFVGGKPDKVKQIRLKLPKAIYCTSDNLVSRIKTIIKNEN